MKLLVAVIVVVDVLLDPVAPDVAARETGLASGVGSRHAVTTIYSPNRTGDGQSQSSASEHRRRRYLRGVAKVLADFEGCRGAMSGV